MYKIRVVVKVNGNSDSLIPTLSCSSIDKALCSGRIIHRCVCCAYSSAASTTADISDMPLRKISKSPLSFAGYCRKKEKLGQQRMHKALYKPVVCLPYCRLIQVYGDKVLDPVFQMLVIAL